MQEIQKWEYFTDYFCEDYKLEKYGNEGWELISIVPSGSKGLMFTFKRPKKEIIHTEKKEKYDSFYAKHGYTEEQDRMYTQMLYGTKQDA